MKTLEELKQELDDSILSIPSIISIISSFKSRLASTQHLEAGCRTQLSAR